MDWTVRALHGLWDSWLHERDVLLPRGIEHPADGDATVYATAYGLFIAAAVASVFGSGPDLARLCKDHSMPTLIACRNGACGGCR